MPVYDKHCIHNRVVFWFFIISMFLCIFVIFAFRLFSITFLWLQREDKYCLAKIDSRHHFLTDQIAVLITLYITKKNTYVYSICNHSLYTADCNNNTSIEQKEVGHGKLVPPLFDWYWDAQFFVYCLCFSLVVCQN